MRGRTLLIASFATLVATLALGAGRTLTVSHDVEGVQGIVLEGSVGKVEVVAGTRSAISGEVEISPKHGVWGGMSQRELERVELSSELRGGTLYLELSPRSHDNDYEEEWTLQVPASIAARIKLGVGDVRVLDLASDVEVRLGVGNVRIEGEHRAFGDIHGSAGVGDARLRTPEGRDSGSGFISHSLSSSGPGHASIQVKTGVGDIDIRLR